MVKDYIEFKKRFLKLTGLDLNCYKDQQMERRIKQFMNRVKVKDYESYIKLLETREEEKIRFLNYLTINTTSFFRDPAIYRKLKSEIIPEILSRKKGKVKLWSAGCSIGAEPYSLAILMTEITSPGRYTIVASDIDEQALEKAMEGIYHPNQLEHLSKKSLNKYFDQKKGLYQLKPTMRNKVTFKKHDMLRNNFEKNCDLILCRNVFIYFKQETQERLLSNFIESLNPQGYLVIGCSENIGDHRKWGLKKVGIAIFQKE